MFFAKLDLNFCIYFSIPSKYESFFSNIDKYTTKLKNSYEKLFVEATNKGMIKLLSNQTYVYCITHIQKTIQVIEKFRVLLSELRSVNDFGRDHK